jgi:hypothetical protein
MTAVRTALEGALIAAVLVPVALHPAVRRTFRGLARPRLAALGAMLILTLAGQLALDARSFPFVGWHMYATIRHGDVTVYEYDAVLRSGASVAVVPGRFLGPESADRLMEALRRQVERVRALGEGPRAGAAWREHEQTLRALAGRYDREHPEDPVASVLVSQRTVTIRSGKKLPRQLLWTVELR